MRSNESSESNKFQRVQRGPTSPTSTANELQRVTRSRSPTSSKVCREVCTNECSTASPTKYSDEHYEYYEYFLKKIKIPRIRAVRVLFNLKNGTRCATWLDRSLLPVDWLVEFFRWISWCISWCKSQ